MIVPSELLEYKQWVLWRKVERDGHATKVPISAWRARPAACDDPRTWSTYRHVCYALHRFQCNGIGFVFTKNDPFCGIDLDQCRAADGRIKPEAFDLIEKIGSYAEISPSGTGVHILLKASLPGKGRRRGTIEVYDSGRYFTITGQHIAGTPKEIRERQNTLDQMVAAIFPPQQSGTPMPTFEPGDLSDLQLLDRARNSRGSEQFIRLWDGETSDYGHDHSRADLALCRILAFWCGGDAARIDRLFRHSGLMRKKWDRRTGDQSYGSLTIMAALSRLKRD
jgi:primase-polymerase (primpol)-like protein